MATKEKRGHWWNKIFQKPDKPKKPIYHEWADILSGLAPIYSTEFGEDIYASDVVQQAVYSIVTELKKLDPVHVRKTGSDSVEVGGNIQSVLDAPNPLMTTSDFIEKVAWNLLLNYNAFVYPMWDGNTLKALYPLQPSKVEFDPDYGGTGETWVRFTFPNGYVGDLPYEEIIHLRYKFSRSEYMGGNEDGKPEHKPLLDTLQLNDALLKGLAKALKIQTTINGLIKLKAVVGMDEKQAKVKEFERRLLANESGLLALDNIEEFTPISKQVALLDNTVLEFIDRKILRNWGVSIAIVNGDYTKEQYEAFYQKVIEPIVKSFSEGFTKGIFSRRAALGFNNKIEFYVKELIFMNTDQKLSLFNMLGNIGGCYVNEMRTAFGMRPINALQGVRMQSLNFVDSQYAQEYQTGTTGDTGGKNGDNGGVTTNGEQT